MFGSSILRATRISKSDVRLLVASNRPPKIIDVRTLEEVAEGRIPKSINIPVTELESTIPKFKWKKSDEMVVYCHAGKRSLAAANTLERLGFTNIKNFSGGWSEWIDSSK